MPFRQHRVQKARSDWATIGDIMCWGAPSLSQYVGDGSSELGISLGGEVTALSAPHSSDDEVRR